MTTIAKIVSDDILNRHFIGYNQIINEFSKFVPTGNNFPPHNVVCIDDNTVLIELALAGFKLDDIDVTVENGVLTVQGGQDDVDEREYHYRGIAARSFKRTFPLAEYWEVTGAKFDDGILTLTLVQEIPEAKKPKTIEIKQS